MRAKPAAISNTWRQPRAMFATMGDASDATVAVNDYLHKFVASYRRLGDQWVVETDGKIDLPTFVALVAPFRPLMPQ